MTATLAITTICTILLALLSSVDASVAKLPNCGDKNQSWVLVNTLDGKLTVLDYNDNGNEIWSIESGPGSMLSSSIDRLELSNNGHWVRIIPSLTGSLYKFNGDTIEGIPVTADYLLTASFRFLEDVVIAGGKEVRTYGVTFHSGKILYECTLHGCTNQTDYENYDDILLVERNTQTVRAVDSRSGVERWNFSVGQMQLKFPQTDCHFDVNQHTTNINLKTVVPEGLVYAFHETNYILWKKQLSSPIVNIWTWDGRELRSVDLFSDTQYAWSLNNVPPSIYIGMHNKQLYIHESQTLQQLRSVQSKRDQRHLIDVKAVWKIPWKPFPAKSSALIIVDNEKETQSYEIESPNQKTTALSVLYATEYVNGNGYYLYNENSNPLCENNVTIADEDDEKANDENDTPVQVIIISLWYWWKEVAMIAVTTAVALNALNQHFINRLGTSSSQTTEPSPNSSNKSSDVGLEVQPYGDATVHHFRSRFLDDFDTIRCLGRGGFGIVFEAKNKIDECAYAIKRITLPNKAESRQRVLREVKALAKLDHRNIVRYFNAWLECPPAHWNDEFELIGEQEMYSDEVGETSYSSKSEIKKNDASVVIDFGETGVKKELDEYEIKKEDTVYTDSYIVFRNSDQKSGSMSGSVEGSDKWPFCNDETVSEKSKTRRVLNTPNRMFVYIQMQLCRKESLQDWLRENPQRNSAQIKTIFEQIVSAVEYVHLKGLIHRDLKPSNIFFSVDGEIKVGDFGLVTGMEECSDSEYSSGKSTSERHTRAVGTQLYMSPEQLNGLAYNYKVDIYSLGVILFELLVSFNTSMERIKTLSDLRNNQFPQTFTDKYEKEHELLKRMLSQWPEQRPTTFGIRAWPPLGDSTEVANHHFELPPRT